MTSDTQRTAAPIPVATGAGNGGSSAEVRRSTGGLAKGSATSSAPGNGAMTRGRALPPPPRHEAPGDRPNRRLGDENRQLAERLPDGRGRGDQWRPTGNVAGPAQEGEPMNRIIAMAMPGERRHKPLKDLMSSLPVRASTTAVTINAPAVARP